VTEISIPFNTACSRYVRWLNSHLSHLIRSTTSCPLSSTSLCEVKLHRTWSTTAMQLIADSGRPQLRSAHANVLAVPRTNTRLGDRSFSVAGPRIWNSLPASLRQPDIEFGHFRQLLKAFQFGETAAH